MGSKKDQQWIQISRATYNRAQEYASYAGYSVSGYIYAAVEEKIARAHADVLPKHDQPNPAYAAQPQPGSLQGFWNRATCPLNREACAEHGCDGRCETNKVSGETSDTQEDSPQTSQGSTQEDLSSETAQNEESSLEDKIKRCMEQAIRAVSEASIEWIKRPWDTKQ